MLIYLAAIGIAATTALVVVLVFQALPQQPRAVQKRLEEVRVLGGGSLSQAKRLRQRRREKLQALLEQVGERMETDDARREDLRLALRRAGITRSGAVPMYIGSKLALGLGMGGFAFFLTTMAAAPLAVVLLVSAYFGLIGWVAPVLWLRVRRRLRQKELQKALPDALDLLVICVEAGQGLNQALNRVADEIGHVSLEMATELAQVNFQIRAGTPREQALQNLSDNTGLPDIRSLVTMLIQTDRFGTSVGRSLRVHSETLREKRKQRAEEAAAKTTIKLVFPLVLCIFPALFVVILTPGLIEIYQALSNL